MTFMQRLYELSARSVELARVQSVSGQILNIKPVPQSVADPILRSMRRKLEKFGDRQAVRAAFLGPKGPRMRRAGKSPPARLKAQARPGYENDFWKPRVVDIDGKKSLLHYRVARSESGLRQPLILQPGFFSSLPSGATQEQLMRHHIIRSGHAISTSTERQKALRFMRSGGKSPVEGIYATPLDELIKNQREKNKAAMINSSFSSEREITQTHGENLLKVRKHKEIIDPTNRGSMFAYVRQR